MVGGPGRRFQAEVVEVLPTMGRRVEFDAQEPVGLQVDRRERQPDFDTNSQSRIGAIPMLISDEKIAELKAALAADEDELFRRVLAEMARMAVAAEQVRQRTIGEAISRERGTRPFAVWQR